MYPAILDVVTAVLFIPLAIAILKWQIFTVWTLIITYLTLSITDHIGALTNLALIGEPIAFEQLNGGETLLLHRLCKRCWMYFFSDCCCCQGSEASFSDCR